MLNKIRNKMHDVIDDSIELARATFKSAKPKQVAQVAAGLTLAGMLASPVAVTAQEYQGSVGPEEKVEQVEVDQAYVNAGVHFIENGVREGKILPGAVSVVKGNDSEHVIGLKLRPEAERATRQNIVGKGSSTQLIDALTRLYGNDVPESVSDNTAMKIAYESNDSKGTVLNPDMINQQHKGDASVDVTYSRNVPEVTDSSRTRGLGKDLPRGQWHIDWEPNEIVWLSAQDLMKLDVRYVQQVTGQDNLCKKENEFQYGIKANGDPACKEVPSSVIVVPFHNHPEIEAEIDDVRDEIERVESGDLESRAETGNMFGFANADVSSSAFSSKVVTNDQNGTPIENESNSDTIRIDLSGFFVYMGNDNASKYAPGDLGIIAGVQYTNVSGDLDSNGYELSAGLYAEGPAGTMVVLGTTGKSKTTVKGEGLTITEDTDTSGVKGQYITPDKRWGQVSVTGAYQTGNQSTEADFDIKGVPNYTNEGKSSRASGQVEGILPVYLDNDGRISLMANYGYSDWKDEAGEGTDTSYGAGLRLTRYLGSSASLDVDFRYTGTEHELGPEVQNPRTDSFTIGVSVRPGDKPKLDLTNKQ